MIISIDQLILCNLISICTGVAIGVIAEYRRHKDLKKSIKHS